MSMMSEKVGLKLIELLLLIMFLLLLILIFAILELWLHQKEIIFPLYLNQRKSMKDAVFLLLQFYDQDRYTPTGAPGINPSLSRIPVTQSLCFNANFSICFF